MALPVQGARPQRPEVVLPGEAASELAEQSEAQPEKPQQPASPLQARPLQAGRRAQALSPRESDSQPEAALVWPREAQPQA